MNKIQVTFEAELDYKTAIRLAETLAEKKEYLEYAIEIYDSLAYELEKLCAS